MDFLIIDFYGNHTLVIEYHGSGHYGKSYAEKQDIIINYEVKRTALSLAGIKLIEVHQGFIYTKLIYDVKESLNLYHPIKYM